MKKNTSERTERAALYGLLTALAMVLGFVESLIPIPFPVPGIRLGLANLVTVAGLYLVGIRGTAAVTCSASFSRAFPLEIRTVWPMAFREAF